MICIGVFNCNSLFDLSLQTFSMGWFNFQLENFMFFDVITMKLIWWLENQNLRWFYMKMSILQLFVYAGPRALVCPIKRLSQRAQNQEAYCPSVPMWKPGKKVRKNSFQVICKFDQLTNSASGFCAFLHFNTFHPVLVTCIKIRSWPAKGTNGYFAM